MLRQNNMSIEYNEKYDILYVTLKECPDSFVDEKHRGVLINLDYKTREIVGLDIWNFKKRMLNNEDVPLPFHIDLRSIFNTLVH